MRVAHTAAEAAVYMTYLYTAYAPQLIKAGANWRRELSGHKKGTPTTALEFAMEKQGHDGALAEPEPKPSAEPEPKPETMFSPSRDSYPTLTSTSTYPHPHFYPRTGARCIEYLQQEQIIEQIIEHDRAVKKEMKNGKQKGKQPALFNQLSEAEKKQTKLMDTMLMDTDTWTETRLQHEIRRGEHGDLKFIKARHGPRAQR